MGVSTSNISSGQAFLKAKNYTMAAKIAEEILAVDPNNQEANHLKFSCYFEPRKLEEALGFSQNWLSRDPKAPLAHLSLICSLLKLEKINEADKALEMLKSSLPYETETIQVSEYLYHQTTGSTQKAENAFGAFKKSAAGLDLSSNEALLKYKGNHYISAMNIYKRLLLAGSANYGDFRFYAFSAFRAMRFDVARKAARDALKLEPSALFMRETIALSYFVFFPPFLFAHAITAFGKLLAEKIGDWGIVAAAMLVVMYYIVYDNYLSSSLPEYVGVIFHTLAISYFVYLEFLYGKNWLAIKPSKRNLSLDNY